MSYLPLRTIQYIEKKFEESFERHSVKKHRIDEFETIYVLDDSLVLISCIYNNTTPVCVNAAEIYADKRDNPFFDIPVEGGQYYGLSIEELTYNEINFKHNHSAFIRQMEEELNLEYLSVEVSYTKFRGVKRLYWCPEEPMPIEYYDKKAPEIKLKERYYTWPGLKYYFIVLEMKGSDGSLANLVAYTVTNPHAYVQKFCGNIIKHKRFLAGEYVRGNHRSFKKVFQSWKNLNCKERLENHLEYFVLEEFHREKDDVWRRADSIYDESAQGKYNHEERSTYAHPINRWKSEELMYKIVRKIFKKYNVIYQHRPFFLKTSIGGQMSYDVFIPKLKLAFEYQGQQHFEPIEFFGGEESYKQTCERDKAKKTLSKLNGIKLIYVNYWEDLTESLIRGKIEEVAQ